MSAIASKEPRELGVVREGDVVAGKYRVERVLGVGGMGVVVAAHHLQLDQKVALKFLLPQALANREIVARFDREARALARIRSEHVARVIDVGALESNAPYMVMEYLEGGDLASWLDHRGVLTVEQTVELVLQACEAVAEAHALGIIHRDLKPANLFCIRTPSGQLSIKVLDFGISKMAGLESSAREMAATRTGSIIGSPFYMSPEQMQSAKAADARSDIWALGVIVFELLTDRVPFEGGAMPELVINVLTSQPLSLSALRPDVPPGLEQVVLRCLEKNRDRRFANVGELAAALVEFGPPRARHSLDVISGIARASGAAGALASPSPSVEPPIEVRRSGATAASWGQTQQEAQRRRRLRRGWLAAGVVGCGGAMAALAVVAAQHGPLPRGSADDASPIAYTEGTLAQAVTLGVPEATVFADTAIDSSVTASTSAGAAVAPPRLYPASRAVVRTPAPAPATPPAPPRPACRPPYFYDAHGNRVFKTECLQ
jgi:serine/threonine-protein kinase